jgi:magnesium-transporting ATPase (P-type)
VNEGRLEVDQSALTGESLPVTLKKGMAAQMGSTAVRGEVNATVKDTGKNTFFGRTAMLLASVDSLGNLQKILMRIVISLTVRPLAACRRLGRCLALLQSPCPLGHESPPLTPKTQCPRRACVRMTFEFGLGLMGCWLCTVGSGLVSMWWEMALEPRSR